MRVRAIAACALALGALVLAAPARAQSDDGPTFKVTGEVRVRGEMLNNLADAKDHDDANPGADDNYDIWPYRVRLGVKGDFGNNVKAVVEVQNFGYFGNEWPAKTTTSGSVPLPISQNNDYFPNYAQDTSLYQAYFELGQLGGSDWMLRVGRQEHTIGNEFLVGDGDFYNGVSFDGVRAMLDKEKWDLNLFYYRLYEPNGDCPEAFGGPCLSNTQDLYGATVDFGIGLGEIEPYVIVYHDGDNTFGQTTYNVGARWTRGADGDKVFDWNVEAVAQNGDTPSDVSIEAYGAEGWFGFNFGRDKKHRVHVGAYIASGDDGTDATKSKAFNPLFQDSWAHNRLGDVEFGDLAQSATAFGVTDINAGWSYRGEKNSFRASVHNLTLNEVPVGQSDELGNELDAAWDFAYNQYLAFTAGLGYIDYGDAVGTDTDPGTRVYAQGRLRF